MMENAGNKEYRAPILTSYRHGGMSGLDFRRFNIPERPVIDFSVNLNPFGMPSVVRKTWHKFVEEAGKYPTPDGRGISHFYQQRFGIAPENILGGNGSTELIYLIPRVIPFKRALIVTPSYHDYERATSMAGKEIKHLALHPEKDFFFPSSHRLSEALRDVDALWLGRPNNPTGTMISKELILTMAARFPETWFFIDEAFVQFTEEWEKESLLLEEPLPNLLVIHSLTKFYCLPGLRMGAMYGSSDIISRLRYAKEPWTINGIADRIAPQLAHLPDYEERTTVLVRQERQRFIKRAQALEGIDAFPPTACFVLCRWKRTRNLDDLLKHLLSHGISVRDCRNFRGLTDNFFRIGLRTPADNDLLISTLSSFVGVKA